MFCPGFLRSQTECEAALAPLLHHFLWVCTICPIFQIPQVTGTNSHGSASPLDLKGREKQGGKILHTVRKAIYRRKKKNTLYSTSQKKIPPFCHKQNQIQRICCQKQNIHPDICTCYSHGPIYGLFWGRPPRRKHWQIQVERHSFKHQLALQTV